MSDVKAFTGFIAVDGSTHNTKKAAIEHTREVKTKQALEKAFGAFMVDLGDGDVTLDQFIYNNRNAITTALNQEVLTRKKRSPNKAKIEGAKPAAVAAVAAGTGVAAAQA